MRLGVLIYSLAGGGAERVVSYLVTFCHNNKIDVHLILMNTNKKYKIPEGLNVHYIEKSQDNESGILKALKIPLLAFKYAKLVKKLQLTHSLSFLTRPCFINILSRKFTSHKFKLITNERAFPSLQYSYKGLQSKFNKKMIKTLYKKADLLISNSHGNAQDLIDNFEVSSDKMKVIHNPIDLDKIKNIEPENGFFDDSKFNIVTVGRLDVGKNHKMLIEAVGKLENSSTRLYIFGEGNIRTELEETIGTLNLKDQVFLMGFDANPYRYLKCADLFVFGSNHEGFPNVLLEAIACQLPILTTNCQSGPSEIMKLGEAKEDLMITDYGILVPIKNADLMAKGIAYFINNDSYIEECKQNGKTRIKDFEKNYILSKYIETINS
ncbi:MAG: glycosyltransferase [Winogradskyella sp.]|uniref:glycosyltransferase n=1 Tax=Winogradskyella sp. TaxID=1883156 RepID=UPI0025D3AA88|nr:glycosyltransferase [Winogradskyella sp.]NRB58891.1 glycosyltransferase [Winogradskyella sp.]